MKNVSEVKRSKLTTPLVQVSWGELIDKITILEIKSVKLKNKEALANVRRELVVLQSRERHSLTNPKILSLKQKLLMINEKLWLIEDKIRQKEAAQEFDAEFIELARSVYRQNDQRSSIKREINLALSSDLIEEKSYVNYHKG